jgi:hypothetical protein
VVLTTEEVVGVEVVTDSDVEVMLDRDRARGEDTADSVAEAAGDDTLVPGDRAAVRVVDVGVAVADTVGLVCAADAVAAAAAVRALLLL